MTTIRIPSIGEKYRHYKGDVVEVIASPSYADNGEKVRIYGFEDKFTVWYRHVQGKKKDTIWVRDLSEFIDDIIVDSDGNQKKRFERLTRGTLY